MRTEFDMPAEVRELLRVHRPAAADEARLSDLIDYLEETDESAWCTDRVRVEGRNCVMGHVFEWGRARGDGSDAAGSRAWDWFEDAWATTYVAYPVNDGAADEYAQPTPRQRCLAYCRDLLAGWAITTQESMEFEFADGDLETLRMRAAA